MNWRISPLARCQKSDSAGVDHQDGRQHVVHRHHVRKEKMPKMSGRWMISPVNSRMRW